jgi:hypothetical protein
MKTKEITLPNVKIGGVSRAWIAAVEFYDVDPGEPTEVCERDFVECEYDEDGDKIFSVDCDNWEIYEISRPTNKRGSVDRYFAVFAEDGTERRMTEDEAGKFSQER